MFQRLHFVFAIAILFGLAASVRAQTFNSVVVFGDSLSDSGNIAQLYGLPAGTSFTTNPDPVWAEIVAQTFEASVTNSLAGGTNYSWGGACVNPNGPCEEDPVPPVPTTEQQINRAFLWRKRRPGYALYDLGRSKRYKCRRQGHILSDSPSQCSRTASWKPQEAYVDQIRDLQDAGARYIVVLNLPDAGKTINAQARRSRSCSWTLPRFPI